MTLDEAIKHAEEVAEEKERKGRSTGCFHDEEDSIYRKECIKCAEEHIQIAEWLKELQAHREALEKVKSELWVGGVKDGN